MSERGERGRKSVHGDGVNRVAGLTPIFRCGMFDALFLREKVWGGHDVKMYPYSFECAEHDGALQMV